MGLRTREIKNQIGRSFLFGSSGIDEGEGPNPVSGGRRLHFDAARMAGCELVSATDEQLDGALDAFLA
jgi:hypothetical protein